MPHIHTDPGEHDLSVTAFVIRIDPDEPRALLHMHRKLKKLLPVGGHVEATETPWQTVARELEEESGYGLNQLKIMQPPHRVVSLSDATLHPLPVSMNTHAITPDHFHTDLEYGFVATGDARHVIREGESFDLRWMTLKELREAPPGLVYANVEEVFSFMIEHGLSHWSQVNTADFSLA
jgi:8-oxo-dGTP diphosphatase